MEDQPKAVIVGTGMDHHLAHMAGNAAGLGAACAIVTSASDRHHRQGSGTVLHVDDILENIKASTLYAGDYIGDTMSRYDSWFDYKPSLNKFWSGGHVNQVTPFKKRGKKADKKRRLAKQARKKNRR